MVFALSRRNRFDGYSQQNKSMSLYKAKHGYVDDLKTSLSEYKIARFCLLYHTVLFGRNMLKEIGLYWKVDARDEICLATVQHGEERDRVMDMGCYTINCYDFELDAFFSSVLLGMPSPYTIWPLA